MVVSETRVSLSRPQCISGQWGPNLNNAFHAHPHKSIQYIDRRTCGNQRTNSKWNVSFIYNWNINVHVSKSTYISKSIQKYIYISKSNQKYMCLHNYPRLSKPHLHVSKTIQATCTCKWNVNVHVSKSTCIQNCPSHMYTGIDMYISHKTHQNSSFLLFFLEGDLVGTTIGLVCVSGSWKLNINC